ncbi:MULTISPECIES: hypothetical protein [unclassified Streptomyces]|uniref:hypothetical protein n=1 Tax=unclassified Streptomyces TaxID=2593676 RepID=UPI0020333D93|nr:MULTISPECIES: hypothetical protein [unclassified Streptomyces]MCM2422899.1 hypothetical protein [Streptomyces sp. RKAG293]MCM2424868.1 hypothetical protein [Streptomyces sp. RKAG337]
MAGSVLDEFQRLPSAILTDGLLPVPLFAVSRLTLSERYTLPPIGTQAFRAAVGNATENVSLSALLIGPQRFAWKQGLELLANFSKRGGALGSYSGGRLSGLILVTRMVVKMNMQVTELSFTASAQRIDTVEVSLSLQHVPRPGPLDLLVDTAAMAAMTCTEFL